MKFIYTFVDVNNNKHTNTYIMKQTIFTLKELSIMEELVLMKVAELNSKGKTHSRQWNDLVATSNKLNRKMEQMTELVKSIIEESI